MTLSFLSAGREGLGVEGVLTHVASVHSLSSEVVTEEAQIVFQRDSALSSTLLTIVCVLSHPD